MFQGIRLRTFVAETAATNVRYSLGPTTLRAGRKTSTSATAVSVCSTSPGAYGVRVMLGLDCDRPRGAFIRTLEGSRMAVQKMLSLERLKCTLDALSLPRTYFVCGQFLESMASMFGAARMRAALAPENPLCEIADHTYSHDVWKSIPTRPDKDPVSPATVIGEYRINSTLFEAILGQDLRARGVRAPLGYYQGIASEVALLDLLSKEGIPYVSSDLRDQDYSIEAPLLKNGEPRQPYRYSNGLVEIPSHGWQDTAFGGRSRTPVSESCPNSYAEIMGYYRCLFSSARAIADRHRRDFFLGLVLHPYSISFYDPLNELFADLRKTAEILGISFCQYRRVCQQFGPNWGSTTRILALGDDDSE